MNERYRLGGLTIGALAIFFAGVALGGIFPSLTSGIKGVAAAMLAQADTRPPKVAITSPKANSTVSGLVAVTANASDNVGVVGVQFKIGTLNLGDEITAPPYMVQWPAAVISGKGFHSISAIARDVAKNFATSTVIVGVECTKDHPCNLILPTPFVAQLKRVTCTAKSITAVFHAKDTCTPFVIRWGDGKSTSYAPSKSCVPILYENDQGPYRVHSYAKAGSYTMALTAGATSTDNYINATTSIKIDECDLR